MYKTLFLCFRDESEANSVLMDDDIPRYAAVDVVGVIYRATGNKLSTTHGLVDEMQAVPGWHVNVQYAQDCPELDAYSVEPVTPDRVWL